PAFLESLDAVGRSPTRRAVVTLSGGAEVAAAAGAVGAGGDVVQFLLELLFLELPEGFAGVLRAGVSGKREDAGGQRRGDAGACHGEPAAVDAVVFGDALRDGRNVGSRTRRAARIVLPRRLGDAGRRAARAGAAPRDLTVA